MADDNHAWAYEQSAEPAPISSCWANWWALGRCACQHVALRRPAKLLPQSDEPNG
jgi:hypothetical protein